MSQNKAAPPFVSAQEFEQLFQRVCNWGRWGPDDDRGTLNYITQKHVSASAALVRSGRTISLALPINTVAGPDNPRPSTHYMVKMHDLHPAEG